MKRPRKWSVVRLRRVFAAVAVAARAQKRVDALERAQDRMREERGRVESIISSDQEHREREDRRFDALREMSAGGYSRSDDIAIPPPLEQMARGYYVPYRAEKIPGTARSIMTVKNLASDRPAQLFRRGVIDAELYVALAWYRRTWELSGLAPKLIGSYSERSTATPAYGHMAKTEEQAEAREEYRWARDQVPADVLSLFEAVVLHDRTLAEEGQADTAVAATATKYRNTKAAFMRASLALFDAVSPRLQIAY